MNQGAAHTSWQKGASQTSPEVPERPSTRLSSQGRYAWATRSLRTAKPSARRRRAWRSTPPGNFGLSEPSFLTTRQYGVMAVLPSRASSSAASAEMRTKMPVTSGHAEVGRVFRGEAFANRADGHHLALRDAANHCSRRLAGSESAAFPGRAAFASSVGCQPPWAGSDCPSFPASSCACACAIHSAKHARDHTRRAPRGDIAGQQRDRGQQHASAARWRRDRGGGRRITAPAPAC